MCLFTICVWAVVSKWDENASLLAKTRQKNKDYDTFQEMGDLQQDHHPHPHHHHHYQEEESQ
jgi:hypothetical protein